MSERERDGEGETFRATPYVPAIAENDDFQKLLLVSCSLTHHVLSWAIPCLHEVYNYDALCARVCVFCVDISRRSIVGVMELAGAPKKLSADCTPLCSPWVLCSRWEGCARRAGAGTRCEFSLSDKGTAHTGAHMAPKTRPPCTRTQHTRRVLLNFNSSLHPKRPEEAAERH